MPKIIPLEEKNATCIGINIIFIVTINIIIVTNLLVCVSLGYEVNVYHKSRHTRACLDVSVSMNMYHIAGYFRGTKVSRGLPYNY